MTADTVSTPDQVTSAPSDLRRLFGSHLIVVGFFTPDYAEAASAFSKNLIEHSVSHHLYARAKVDGGWRALYAENKDLIGADPSDIAPGQTLDTGAH